MPMTGSKPAPRKRDRGCCVSVKSTVLSCHGLAHGIPAQDPSPQYPDTSGDAASSPHLHTPTLVFPSQDVNLFFLSLDGGKQDPPYPHFLLRDVLKTWSKFPFLHSEICRAERKQSFHAFQKRQRSQKGLLSASGGCAIRCHPGRREGQTAGIRCGTASQGASRREIREMLVAEHTAGLYHQQGCDEDEMQLTMCPGPMPTAFRMGAPGNGGRGLGDGRAVTSSPR